MTPLGLKNAGLGSRGESRAGRGRKEDPCAPRASPLARPAGFVLGISQATGSAPRWRRKRTGKVQVEEEEPTGYIRYEKFLPVMTRVLLERKYRPIAEDLLLRAFEVLDSAKRGFLTKEELVKYMTEEGLFYRRMFWSASHISNATCLPCLSPAFPLRMYSKPLEQ
ncbi:Dynein regulatory complex protein 8 [Lemmus lemmus]